MTTMEINSYSLAAMRAKGGQWAAYRNQAFDSSMAGHLAFMQYGPSNTYSEPPKRFPGEQLPCHWAYVHIGHVDLTSGSIVEGEK